MSSRTAQALQTRRRVCCHSEGTSSRQSSMNSSANTARQRALLPAVTRSLLIVPRSWTTRLIPNEQRTTPRRHSQTDRSHSPTVNPRPVGRASAPNKQTQHFAIASAAISRRACLRMSSTRKFPISRCPRYLQAPLPGYPPETKPSNTPHTMTGATRSTRMYEYFAGIFA